MFVKKPSRFVITCYELVIRPSYRSTGDNFHEVEWLVGPIPEEGSGTEVVMSYGPKQGFPGKEFCIYLRSFSLVSVIVRSANNLLHYKIYSFLPTEELQ